LYGMLLLFRQLDFYELNDNRVSVGHCESRGWPLVAGPMQWKREFSLVARKRTRRYRLHLMIRFPDFNGLALAGSCNVALVYWLDQIEDSMVGSRAMQLDVFRMCPEEGHRCIGGSTEAKIWRYVWTIPDLFGHQSNSLDRKSTRLNS